MKPALFMLLLLVVSTTADHGEFEKNGLGIISGITFSLLFIAYSDEARTEAEVTLLWLREMYESDPL